MKFKFRFKLDECDLTTRKDLVVEYKKRYDVFCNKKVIIKSLSFVLEESFYSEVVKFLKDRDLMIKTCEEIARDVVKKELELAKEQDQKYEVKRLLKKLRQPIIIEIDEGE